MTSSGGSSATGRHDWGSSGQNCSARRSGSTSCAWPASRTPRRGRSCRSTTVSDRSPTPPTGVLPRTGPTGGRSERGAGVQRGEVWFAATPGGDRPVLVLTRDPVAERIGSVVVAALTRTRRNLVSEVELTPADGMPTDCVVNFDNLHTLPRELFRRRIAELSPVRMAQACRAL